MLTNHYTSHFEKVHEYLNRFEPLSKEEFECIKQFFEIRSFEKKYRMVNTGDIEDYCNLVIKGLARKYILAGKKEVTQQLAMEGHIIHSEVSFITRRPSPVIIETIEPSIFISIKYDHVQELFKLVPKLERLGRLMVTDLFIKKDASDFTYLNKTTRERFLEYLQTYPHILQRVPQKYIASYLDIKPETFSRLKHLLKKRKEI